MEYSGGCHCTAVRFSVVVDGPLEIEDCNCSICAMSGFLHLIVPKSRFRLHRGQHALTTYTFNSGVAKHTFCRHCGIKPFYTPRSNPDGIDINLRCLDTLPEDIRIVPFDGQHWEDNAHTLAYKSQEP